METHGNKTTSTEKIIYYRKGDESYPRIEDLSKEDWSQYFFSDIYEKAVGLIQDIVQINLLNKRNKDRCNYANNVESTNSLNIRLDISVNNVIPNSYDTRNNIIAFVGERGSGKTSCLQTVYNNIPKIERLRNLQCKFNNHMPIIDPSYFNEHSNILEIVIAQMFQIFKDALQHPEKYFLHDDNLLEKKRNLVKCFQEVKETLDCIDTPIKSSDTNDSVEALSRMAASNNLKQQMEKLIDSYLSYFNGQCKSVLIIAIDDLDVQTKHTYTMLEQISKYLIVDRVVILIGVKLKQLSDLVKQNYYIDFQQLLQKNDVTNNQIDDMASRYLLKLIPFSHRLMLPSIHESIDLKILIVDDNYEDEITSKVGYIDDVISGNEMNITRLLKRILYERTRITFYNSLEQESLIIPHNFREMLNLLSFVLKLPIVGKMRDEYKRRELIIKNRNAFKYYFLNSWCLDKLSADQYMFMKELVDYDIIQINKFVIDTLYKWYSEYLQASNIIDSEIFSRHNRNYNISIADVQTVLDVLSTNNDTKLKRLIFAVKTVYSMFLYEKFYEVKYAKDIDTNYNALIARFNHTIKSTWQFNNKLSYLSDYEKLIGGNILNIFRAKDQEGKYINEEAYIGNVDGEKLNSIYNAILKKYIERIKSNLSNDISYDDNEIISFNVFEFFLLCELVENPLQDYRSSKHCYYDSFPINDLSDQQITFSFTAILSNTIRFYKLYQLYSKMPKKMKEDYNLITKYNNEISRFILFFQIVDLFGNNSLIYRILHSTNDGGTEDKHSQLFKNNFLEDFFLINIEEIDILEKYMGHINKRRASLNVIHDHENRIEKLRYKQNELEENLRESEQYTNKLNVTRYDLVLAITKETEISKQDKKKLIDELHRVEQSIESIESEKFSTKSKLEEIKKGIIQLESALKTHQLTNQETNISNIKSFFEKLSAFKYYVRNNSITGDDTNVDHTKSFDFIECIVNKFDDKKFTNCFYDIYMNIDNKN